LLNRDTDRQWEKFGRDDPYYGVYTDDKYRRTNLTEQAKQDFFASGREHVAHILEKIRESVDSRYSIRTALDFGCGVGRVTIALAEVAETVTGIDVSESMLNEARKNCRSSGTTNVSFVRSDDKLSLVSGRYNFLHSYVVFQHIPVSRGKRIFARLLDRLEDGGVGVVHFTYAKSSGLRTAVDLAKNYVPFASSIAGVLKGRDFFAPVLQMNSYDVNKLLSMVQGARATDFHAEFTNHGGELGINLYFQKPEIGDR
jgi:trans-aconitate methyltransferase